MIHDPLIQSGNPCGRPKGARNHNKLYEEAIAQHQDELIQKGISMAKAGNEQMLRLFLEKILPAKPQDNALPSIDIDQSSIATMANSTMQAVYSGEITPNEGINVLSLIKTKAELVELKDLKKRVKELQIAIEEMKQNNAPYQPPIVVESVSE